MTPTGRPARSTDEGVRALRREDLHGVRLLLEEFARNGGAHPPSPVEEHLARILLDDPWADPELPPLVYGGVDGEILGLILSHTRRLVCDDRRLRVRCAGGFVVDGRARGRGIGSQLLACYLAGPQDLAVVDAANGSTRRRWMAAGGQTLVHASIGWRRVLRPGAAAAGAAWSARRAAPVRRTVSALARPVDALAAAVPPVRDRLRPARTGTTGELLTPQMLTRLVVDRGLRLRPDYDASYLTWLVGELEAGAPGRLARTVVRGPGGAELGWYLYSLVNPTRAQVLQIGACTPDAVGAVLDHLLADADARAVAVVEGRLEPDLVDVLRTRRATLHPTTWTVVHGADPVTAGLLGSTESMFSRLDGGWWNGYLLWRPWPRTDAPRRHPAASG